MKIPKGVIKLNMPPDECFRPEERNHRNYHSRRMREERRRAKILGKLMTDALEELIEERK